VRLAQRARVRVHNAQASCLDPLLAFLHGPAEIKARGQSEWLFYVAQQAQDAVDKADVLLLCHGVRHDIFEVLKAALPLFTGKNDRQCPLKNRGRAFQAEWHPLILVGALLTGEGRLFRSSGTMATCQ